MTIKLYNEQNTEATFYQLVDIHSKPKFKGTLDTQVDLVVGTAKQWKLPEPDPKPFDMRTINPFLTGIPKELTSFLTFDASERTFIWIDDAAARSVVVPDANYTVSVFIINNKNDVASYYQRLNITLPQNNLPYFADLAFIDG